MGLTLTSFGSTYPVSLSDMKSHLRVIGNAEDVLISRYIKAATHVCQTYMDRPLVESNYTYSLDFFPQEICLPLIGVTSISQISYYNKDNSKIVLGTSEYFYDLSANPVNIVSANSWPSTFARPAAVDVDFQCAAQVLLSEDIKQAIIIVAAEMYEYREDRVRRMPQASEFLLNPHKMSFLS